MHFKNKNFHLTVYMYINKVEKVIILQRDDNWMLFCNKNKNT